MEAPTPTFPTELAFIVGESHIADTPLSWIAPEEMPGPFRGLLAHDHDMTSELAAHHGDTIRLEVLKSERHDHCHLREVVLHAATSGRAVEYGVIEILLDAFPAVLHADILSGTNPLGTLIVQSRIPFRSKPQGFFTIPSEAIAGIFPESAGGEILYGRYNHLIRSDDNRCLARIIEILPR
jgi:hypothetical protein